MKIHQRIGARQPSWQERSAHKRLDGEEIIERAIYVAMECIHFVPRV
jgi:hypothetical protein